MNSTAGRIAWALALAAVVLTGCTDAGERSGGRTDGRTEPLSATPSARTIPFDLYTHCGIDEARIGSTYYEAETPLSNGEGSPPAGWDNPVQRGTMTVKSATQAVFTDDAGHEVTFRARPGATAFKQICH